MNAPADLLASCETGPAIADRLGDEISTALQRFLRFRVASVQIVRPPFTPHVTVAIVSIDNGHVLMGKSAPDPSIYDPKRGLRKALEEAFRQFGKFEDYGRASRDLWRRSQAGATAEVAS